MFGFVCERECVIRVSMCVLPLSVSLCVSLHVSILSVCVSFTMDVRVVRGRRGCRLGGSCRSS